MKEVLVTHGHTGPMVRCLQETGKQARAVVTRFSADETPDVADEEDVVTA